MRRIFVLVVIAVFLAGCGVPIQQRAVPVDREAIRRDSRGPSRLVRTGDATPGKPTVQVNFVRNDRLVAVVRDATQTPVPDRSTPSFRHCWQVQRQRTGRRPVIGAPPDLALKVADVQGTHVVLDLSSQTDGRSVMENALAVGQIVLSVTAPPTVDEVSFQRDSAPVEALLADGALTTQPLTAADYDSLRAR